MTELETRVKQACAERGLSVAVFRRDSLHQVTLIVQRPGNQFWRVVGRIAARPSQQVEVELYHSLLEDLARFEPYPRRAG